MRRFGHSMRFTFTTSTSPLCLSRHGRPAQLPDFLVMEIIQFECIQIKFCQRPELFNLNALKLNVFTTQRESSNSIPLSSSSL